MCNVPRFLGLVDTCFAENPLNRVGIVYPSRMSVPLKITTAVMRFHGRQGPNKVFGEDVDARKKFDDENAENRFIKCWQAGLSDAVDSAKAVGSDIVREALSDRYLRFFDEQAEHRIFRYAGLQFIAQVLHGTLNQLWYVPAIDNNPKLLRVVFETVAERDAFRQLANRLGWDDQQLGLALVRDFAHKHRA